VEATGGGRLLALARVAGKGRQGVRQTHSADLEGSESHKHTTRKEKRKKTRRPKGTIGAKRL